MKKLALNCLWASLLTLLTGVFPLWGEEVSTRDVQVLDEVVITATGLRLVLAGKVEVSKDGEAIDCQDIPAAYKAEGYAPAETRESELLQMENLKEAKLAFEKEFINCKLEQYQNNITKTAEAIGVGRSYLHKKIKSFK